MLFPLSKLLLVIAIIHYYHHHHYSYNRCHYHNYKYHHQNHHYHHPYHYRYLYYHSCRYRILCNANVLSPIATQRRDKIWLTKVSTTQLITMTGSFVKDRVIKVKPLRKLNWYSWNLLYDLFSLSQALSFSPWLCLWREAYVYDDYLFLFIKGRKKN